MLDLSDVDLRALADALEDNSDTQSWWLDPTSGAIDEHLEDGFGEADEFHSDEQHWIAIDPIDPSDAYEDLSDFTDRVPDHRARDLLRRAISGRGAFRRFKDTLFEFPDLRDAWFRFHDARMRRRALGWLREHGLVQDRVIAEALEAIEPEPFETSRPLDATTVARDAARDLKDLLGDDLREVVLFGSWARGDAHPESDIDLLLVMAERPDRPVPRAEIDEILWRHSFANDTVLSGTVVTEDEFAHKQLPLLINVRREGVPVA